MNLSSDKPSDTIVAISTPRGYSGVGLIRMSGPNALHILRKVFFPRNPKIEFKNRQVVYGVVKDPDLGKPIDDGLAFYLEGPHTYTGEDMVELSLHGSPVVLDMVMEIFIGNGARPAIRGEFTRRAFLAGKLDLIQTEAVIDLIESSGPIAAEEARARLDRRLSNEVQDLSNVVKDLLAELEAYIDFDDDEEGPVPDPLPKLKQIIDRIAILKDNAQSARICREGVSTVIIGKPNVGKSTLFNALLGMDRTIVTEHPGTTRDTVEDHLLIGGMSFVLCDTAGIRAQPGPVEAEGIRRTYEKIRESDLILAVLDGSMAMDDEDLLLFEAISGRDTVIVINKVDLGIKYKLEEIPMISSDRPYVTVSAKTGEGLIDLKTLLAKEGKKKSDHVIEGATAGLNSRGLLLANEAAVPINSMLAILQRGDVLEPEIISLELRRALAPLQEITGEKVSEGVLDRIFERFCVGK